MITIKSFVQISKKLLLLHKAIESNYDGDKYLGPNIKQVQHNVARMSGLKCWSQLYTLSQVDLENAYNRYIASWK